MFHHLEGHGDGSPLWRPCFAGQRDHQPSRRESFFDGLFGSILGQNQFTHEDLPCRIEHFAFARGQTLSRSRIDRLRTTSATSKMSPLLILSIFAR